MSSDTHSAAATELSIDAMVRRAMLKWPAVPACAGWLSLDARGTWRLAGETIQHPGIQAFFGRNYCHDAQGRWFVQNGPQRVYVALARAPFCLRLEADGSGLFTHTGARAHCLDRLIVTELGEVYFVTEFGLGHLCDRDLEGVVTRISADSGSNGSAFFSAPEVFTQAPAALGWNGRQFDGLYLADQQLEQTFNFTRRPAL